MNSSKMIRTACCLRTRSQIPKTTKDVYKSLNDYPIFIRLAASGHDTVVNKRTPYILLHIYLYHALIHLAPTVLLLLVFSSLRRGGKPFVYLWFWPLHFPTPASTNDTTTDCCASVQSFSFFVHVTIRWKKTLPKKCDATT